MRNVENEKEFYLAMCFGCFLLKFHAVWSLPNRRKTVKFSSCTVVIPGFLFMSNTMFTSITVEFASFPVLPLSRHALEFLQLIKVLCASSTRSSSELQHSFLKV